MTGAPRHYMTGTRIHNIWKGILDRCYNANRAGYKNYGGRGIEVVQEWHTFENFLRDMGASYKDGLTIERKDNDWHYCKENCVWAPKSKQSANRRSSAEWDFKTTPIKSNTSGIRGVRWDSTRQKWGASISIDGKQKNLGRFASAEEAELAYLQAVEMRALSHA